MRGCYVHTQDLLQLDSHHPNIPVGWCTRGATPLGLDRLHGFLGCYPDAHFFSYLAQGLSTGFCLGFNQASTLHSVLRNHPCSTHHPQTIMDHLASEAESGRLVGPLPSSIASLIQVSPLGLVHNSHSDKWRLIVDLSSPRGRSMNDGISLDLSSLLYASVDYTVDVIIMLRRSALLEKFDLSCAYPMVKVHPDDQPLLGFAFQGNVYMDRSMPFGLRSAPKIFDALADFLAWLLYHNRVPYIVHYLDDFLTMAPSGSGLASSMRPQVDTMLDYMGAPIAHHILAPVMVYS